MKNLDLYVPNAVAALWCKIRGHEWRALMGTDYASVCMVCMRCRENGWRL